MFQFAVGLNYFHKSLFWVWPFVSFHVSFHVHLVSFGCENCSQYKQLLPCDYNSAVNSFLPNNIVIRFKRGKLSQPSYLRGFHHLVIRKTISGSEKASHSHFEDVPSKAFLRANPLFWPSPAALISCTASIKKEMLFLFPCPLQTYSRVVK